MSDLNPWPLTSDPWTHVVSRLQVTAASVFFSLVYLEADSRRRE